MKLMGVDNHDLLYDCFFCTFNMRKNVIDKESANARSIDITSLVQDPADSLFTNLLELNVLLDELGL